MRLKTRSGMSMEEFIRQYEEAPFELVHGERIPLQPAAAAQAEVVMHLIDGFTDAKITFFFGIPFVVTDRENRVKESRTPSLLAYKNRRWHDYQRRQADWLAKPFALVPDLCVEVIPADGSALDGENRVNRYLSDGVRLIWTIDLRQFTLTVCEPEHSARLTIYDTLNGGDLLPGFHLPVRALFSA